MEIYTDGASSKLLKVGGVGIVFVENGDVLCMYHRKFPNKTNNQCEILAVAIALHALKEYHEEVKVYSDSQYVIGTITQGWKRKKNQEHWAYFDKQYANALTVCPNISFHWVKGHADNKFNNLADKLAQSVYEEI